VDQRYKSATFIPAGKLLAVYSGSLERVRSGEEEALNHSMDQGQIDFKHKLHVDGTCLGIPSLGACSYSTTAANQATTQYAKNFTARTLI
jgi:hypothetical protein